MATMGKNLANRPDLEVFCDLETLQERCQTLQGGLRRRDAELAKMVQIAESERNAWADEHQAIAVRTEELNAQVAYLESDISARDVEHEKLRTQMAELKAQIAEKNFAIKEQGRTLEKLNAQYAAVLRSRSWRVMGPFRWAVRLMKPSIVKNRPHP